MRIARWISVTLVATMVGLFGASTAAAQGETRQWPVKVDLLVTGLLGSIGGAIGPDGALYVPQGAVGDVKRIDVETGQVSTFASGLPPVTAALALGGPIDMAFVEGVGYVLVTLVGPETFGPLSTGSNGLYRVNPDGSSTLVTDLGAFSAAHPPAGSFEWFVPGGVQYAVAAVDGGFVVTDGHHNRMLHVGLDGTTSVIAQFANVVPAGIDVVDGQLLLAKTGAVTEIGDSGQYEELGEITRIRLADPSGGIPLTSGISMPVDVQRGPGKSVYVLSQGTWDPNLGPEAAGVPALPFTGQLLRVNEDGTASTVVAGLNLPTSLHFVGGTAFIVTLTGDVWKVRGLSGAQRR